MAFKIAPHPSNPFQRSYADNRDIIAYILGPKIINSSYGPYLASQKLPLDVETHFNVPLTDGRKVRLIVSAGNPSKTGDWRGKRSTHRCHVHCPDCNAVVPAGRTHQHKCK